MAGAVAFSERSAAPHVLRMIEEAVSIRLKREIEILAQYTRPFRDWRIDAYSGITWPYLDSE